MHRQLSHTHPDLPLHSQEAERRLREKALREEAKRVKHLSPTAAESIRTLNTCTAYLENNTDLTAKLSVAARKKRTYERSSPAYKWVALTIVVLGLFSLLYGIYSLITKAGFAMYFLLFGLAAIFLFSSANVLPTAQNNRKAIEQRLADAESRMETFVSAYPGFPVPARYAHPIVLKRMETIITQGRAETLPQALEVLKKI